MGKTQDSSGKLYVVGTPIGNLDDASPRALQVLGSVDAVLCEDTRVTSKLLARFGISVALERCDENVIRERAQALVERISAGQKLAFVSDAGMPCISDPGQVLVDAVLDAGLPCEVVPGPSAVSCALAASGLRAENFFFAGFVPRKAGEQQRLLERLARVPGALVFYESPRRVAKSLAVLAQVLPTRRIALCRELTKLHEEVLRGSAQELLAMLEAREDLKGECVLVVEAPDAAQLDALERAAATTAEEQPSLEDAIRSGLDAGEAPTKLAKRLAKSYGIARDEVYKRVVDAR